jgi:hypothetical protein
MYGLDAPARSVQVQATADLTQMTDAEVQAEAERLGIRISPSPWGSPDQPAAPVTDT